MLALPWYMVQHAPPCPPGSRGLAEGPPGAACSAPQHTLPRTPWISPCRPRKPAPPGQGCSKIYEVDPLRCTRCGSQMRVLAVITDPQQVLRILRHLIKTGAAPPGTPRRFSMLTLLPPVPTRARFLPSHEPCNPRVDRDRFLQPSVPARGISSALPAESVALSQLLSGPNSSLDSCEAPVRPDNRYYHL